MDIQLYTNASDRKVLNKNITLIDTVDAKLKGPMSLRNPSFLLRLDEETYVNYCYINDGPFFGRYYYIDDIILNQNGLSEIRCSEDVLMSYKSDILNQTCILDRQESKANAYLPDAEWKADSRTNILTRPFPSGFEGMSTIITVLGGGH